MQNKTHVDLQQIDNLPQGAYIAPPPEQDNKIVLFQLVTPSTCTFLCLSEKEDNDKMEVGIMKR